MPFSRVFGTKGSIGTRCSPLCRVSIADQTCARQEWDLRAFAKKAGYKVVGVWKGNASGAKQEVLALAQACKVDVILVTELTRRGRSAKIAARSLTCFKFRFVSSPLIGVLPTVVSPGAIWTEIESGFHIELKTAIRINVFPDQRRDGAQIRRR